MLKDRIKELRTNADLTLKAFADSIGVSGPAVSNYESGKKKPGDKTLQKIAEAYNVSKEWLTGEAEDIKEAAEMVKAAVEIAAPVVTEEAVTEMKTRGRKTKRATETVNAEEAIKLVEKTEEAVTPVIEKKRKADPAEKKATIKKAEKAPEEKAESKKAEKAPKKKNAPTDEKKPAPKKSTPKKRATKKASSDPEFIIESLLGGQISTKEILKKVPKGAEKIYVKPEENKAYYSIGDEVGSVDLW